MQATNTAFYLIDSVSRIDEILAASDSQYEETKAIPDRARLTFTNGYYVDCAAVFVDIRGSSKLAERYNRPTLAKLYRAYLSEVIAVLNASPRCREITVEGDCVAAVMDTPYKSHIDDVFGAMAQTASTIKVLNCRLEQRAIDPIRVGIGAHYGRALMVKAGYKGSAINEVVWMGDVLNEASALCNAAGKGMTDTIAVSSVFYDNLNEHNQSLLRPARATYGRDSLYRFYHGDVVNTSMEDWYKANCT